MSSITQISMFSWDDFENIGDLERLRILLDHIPDQRLIYVMSKERKNGRNDYPVEPMWNAILAGVVFQHASTSSLVRELSRNAQLSLT